MRKHEVNSLAGLHLGLLNGSMLFQFVLLRWIAAESDLSLWEQFSSKKSFPQPIELSSVIERLIGQKHFPWHVKIGSLISLHDSCHKHYSANSIPHKDNVILCHYAQKLIKACQSVKEILNSHPLSLNASDNEQLETALKEGITCMRQFKRLLLKILPNYYNDENMLFFLLRHGRHLNAHLGKYFIENIITKMHPAGIQEVSQFVSRRYQERGYNSLSIMIQQRIESITQHLLPNS